MSTFVYDVDPKHKLKVGSKTVHGGEKLELTAQREKELRAQGIPLKAASEAKADDAGDGDKGRK